MNKENTNTSSFNQIEELGDIFNITVASDFQQVWFVRISGGDYYDDFRLYGANSECSGNEVHQLLSEKDFKNRVTELYPDEKRPGLVYGQLNTFYNVMQVGGWVVIPSKGTQDLTIGILGDIIHEEVKRKAIPEQEYATCGYIHKRSVSWQRELPASYDIYLQKSLRAQQTISNITDISSLVFRHLYPVYVVNNEVRINFQKTTEGELNILSNIDLIGSIVDIADQIANLYKVESFTKDFTMKTAVGSPGIIELIIPMLSSAPMVLGAVMLWILLGKYDSEKGISSGLT